jgi:hypothetical protein
MRNGKRVQAIEDFESALKFDPTSDRARKNLTSAREEVTTRASPPPQLPPLPHIKDMLKVPEFSQEEERK